MTNEEMMRQLYERMAAEQQKYKAWLLEQPPNVILDNACKFTDVYKRQVQIGKTTFIVCVKQSETAKKPIEKMFKDMCRHEVTRDFLADNLMNLEKLPKTS